MSRRKHIPLSWDDDDTDDWIAPSASSSAEPPTLLTTNARPPARTLYEPELTNSQPRTLYQPELKILKRNTAPTAPAASPASASASPRLSPASARRERERRYQEVKDRIFNNTASAPSNPGSANTTPPNASPAPTPPPQKQKPKKKSQGAGAITSISLNSATITAAPVVRREKEEWKIRQVEIDGKMLESQAEKYLGDGAEEGPAATADEEGGLEWDEFRRDVLWKPDDRARVYEGEVELVKSVEGLRVEERTGSPVKAARGPVGPDANGGKGFKGRGNGRMRGG